MSGIEITFDALSLNGYPVKCWCRTEYGDHVLHHRAATHWNQGPNVIRHRIVFWLAAKPLGREGSAEIHKENSWLSLCVAR